MRWLYKLPRHLRRLLKRRRVQHELSEELRFRLEKLIGEYFYKFPVGDRKSTRDKIAAGYVVTSLFLTDFAPGGTNFPHHHETAEEIYLVLDSHGKMVAGGGMDGIEGFHVANGGDTYFFRLNCTVGFYNSPEAGAKAHILAVRSRFPFRNGED